jgi:hypothetical protein
MRLDLVSNLDLAPCPRYRGEFGPRDDTLANGVAPHLHERGFAPSELRIHGLFASSASFHAFKMSSLGVPRLTGRHFTQNRGRLCSEAARECRSKSHTRQ